jgi:murein L,D-transpeptidase YcbB/YkuD
MWAELEGSGDTDKLLEQHSDLDSAVDDLEPVLSAVPPKNGARTRFSNLRWSTQRIAAVLEFESEDKPSFTVGPVTAEQAALTREKMDALVARAGEMKAGLEQADPEMMYRNILISQMDAFVKPAAQLKVDLGQQPWWTPEAYQAVTQCQRLVDLTKNETRKLTPELMEQLKRVWSACEELVAAANDIEKGARGTGPDAQINYLEKPRR